MTRDLEANVALEVDVRRIGDVMLVKCKGRIVAGPESHTLQQHMTELLETDRHFVLHLGDVNFVDSSGLGLLVRLAGVSRAKHGDVKLCSVGHEIAHTLNITNLKQILETHETEVEALGAFYNPTKRNEAAGYAGKKILCVDKSENLLALLRELLRHAGYAPVTTSNLNDARLLAKATRPALVVIGPNVGEEHHRGIHNTIGTTPHITLEAAFATLDSREAAEQVLSAVREKVS